MVKLQCWCLLMCVTAYDELKQSSKQTGPRCFTCIKCLQGYEWKKDLSTWFLKPSSSKMFDSFFTMSGIYYILIMVNIINLISYIILKWLFLCVMFCITIQASDCSQAVVYCAPTWTGSFLFSDILKPVCYPHCLMASGFLYIVHLLWVFFNFHLPITLISYSWFVFNKYQ